MDGIHENVDGLQDGNKKECPKCKEIRDISDYKDNSLKRGFGRFCKHCKGGEKVARKQRKSSASPQGHIREDIRCPRCNSGMILRYGSKGAFYGCSQFPRCRGTRSYNGK